MANQEQTELKEGDIVEKKSATGFPLEGGFVKNLTDKHFVIVGHRTQMVKDLDNKENLIEKLILLVRLADGTIVDYYPNKTSQKVVICKRGYNFDQWIDFAGEFETKSQRVGKEDKEVIYIKDDTA